MLSAKWPPFRLSLNVLRNKDTGASSAEAMGHVTLVGTTGTTIPMSYLKVKSLKLNSFQDWVSILVLWVYSLFKWVAVAWEEWQGTRILVPAMATWWHSPVGGTDFGYCLWNVLSLTGTQKSHLLACLYLSLVDICRWVKLVVVVFWLIR